MIKAEKTNEIVEGKIKAIYPHITVTGDVDKPYYNIDWYDIEKKTMYRGYSSYDLKLVKKWLQEDFEVVEEDIDNLINLQQEEIQAHKEKLHNRKSEVNRLNSRIGSLKANLKAVLDERSDHTEVIKKFTEKLIFEIVNRPAKANPDGAFYNNGRVDRQNEIIDIINELAGNKNTTSP